VSPAPYYVKALALGVPACLVGIHLWTWVFSLPLYLSGYADFRQLYTAGYMLRTGHAHQLYNYTVQAYFQNKLVTPMDVSMPFIRPAYEGLLFIPFSFLSFKAAYFVFLGVNLMMLAVTYYLIRRSLENLARIVPWLPAAMFLGFLPIAAALIQGQDSVILLTLLTATAVSLQQGSEFRAGVFAGLGFFKFQITIPIAILFLAWRRWRFTTGFSAAALVLGTISLWIVGLAQASSYCRSLLFMGSSSPNGGYPLALGLMANLHGLIFGLIGNTLPGKFVILSTLLASVAVFVWCLKSVPKPTGMDAVLLGITVSALVSYYLFMHDLSIMALPIAVMLNRFIEGEATGDKSGRIMTRVAALLFVSPMCISYTTHYFYLVSVPLCVFLFVLVERLRRDAVSKAGTGIADSTLETVTRA